MPIFWYVYFSSDRARQSLIDGPNQNPLEYHKDCQKSHTGLMRIKYVFRFRESVLYLPIFFVGRAFPVKRLADVIDTLGLEPRFPVPAFGSRGVRIGPQFSLDLVAAVKRQASFVAQVAAVGWTQRPRGIQDIASSCIDKYHAFLKKLWENPNHLAVPTLVCRPSSLIYRCSFLTGNCEDE